MKIKNKNIVFDYELFKKFKPVGQRKIAIGNYTLKQKNITKKLFILKLDEVEDKFFLVNEKNEYFIISELFNDIEIGTIANHISTEISKLIFNRAGDFYLYPPCKTIDETLFLLKVLYDLQNEIYNISKNTKQFDIGKYEILNLFKQYNYEDRKKDI